MRRNLQFQATKLRINEELSKGFRSEYLIYHRESKGAYICNMFEAPINLPQKPLKATWEKHDLVFKRPAITSRETFKTKDILS